MASESRFTSLIGDADPRFPFPYGDSASVTDSKERNIIVPRSSVWKTRLVEGSFPDRWFDIEFWQEQGDEAIFAAAWEMVELAEEIRHGGKPTLQKTVTTLKRLGG